MTHLSGGATRPNSMALRAIELRADHPLASLRQPKDLHASDNAVDGSSRYVAEARPPASRGRDLQAIVPSNSPA
jgi:hypothetical protein